MKAPKLLFLALIIIAASAELATAQATINVKPGSPRQAANMADEQDNEIIDEIFSPITQRLNLTAGQKFRITNIATAFEGRLQESAIREVSERQAALLSQIISMKARAKMSFYRILTAEQRAVVVDQFRSHAAEGNLGSISN